MKKIYKGLLCMSLVGVLAVSAAGCGNGPSEHRDPNTQPLRLALGAVDKVFNPLFYTSQNDGEIASMTQVSLLTADENGVLAYGENYPTVALDYKETYYSGTTVLGTSDGKGEVQGANVSNATTTTYEFLIKNGVKFSDGKPLTLLDVMFNLYVYLDPVYSGSSTIYSTKIVGLQDYKKQQVGADSSAEDMTPYYTDADTRVQNILDWIDDGADESALTKGSELESDIAEARRLYEQELETDWNSIVSGWTESYKEYRFTQPWQAFFYVNGIVKDQTELNENGATVSLFEDLNGNGTKDDGEKYYTTLDPNVNEPNKGDVEAQELIDEATAAYSDAKINEFLAKPENAGYTREAAINELQKEYVVNHVYNAYGVGDLKYVLSYTGTASTFYDYLVKSAMSKIKGGNMIVERIEGIQGSKLTAGQSFNGKTLTEDHEVLKITIEKVDPKAKWNFAFAVAPAHYYSNEEYYNKAKADYDAGKYYDGTATNFGVKFSDIKWFNEELSGGEKTGVPVGAGPYKCTSYNYDSSNVTRTNFFYMDRAYFEKNEYFTTLGSGVDNAKIKYVTYSANVADDKIVEYLKTGLIDYGTPTATSDNQKSLKTGNLEQITYKTGGYGYIGINPKAVEDLEVRKAIMHAINTSSLTRYYGESLVELINRPVSKTSWASPDNAERYYPNMASNIQGLRDMITNAQSGNWYYDEVSGKILNTNNDQPLKLTFTIAGESKDHPAYNIFLDAERVLEQVGMDITVTTDILALQQLQTGNLAVWAAAWSSSIDPDPYQLYSVNSMASSTKNWNKDNIVKDGGTGKFAREYRIALELSERIEQGRSVLSQTSRADIYNKSTGGKLGDNFTDADLQALCAFDLIMELAVEFPTYQRYDLCVYNSAVIDASSMTQNPSYNMGPIAELWKLAYKA